MMQKEMMHAPQKLRGGVSAKKFCIKLLLTLAVLAPISSPARFETNAAPPTLLIARQGTNIVLKIIGGNSFSYAVEINDALGTNTNWTKIHTNTTSGSGIALYTNFNAVVAFPKQFYRLEAL